jgi:hypothetical protein
MEFLSRNHHRFEPEWFAFNLWRLTDEEYRQLQSHSWLISVDNMFLTWWQRKRWNKGQHWPLPKDLVVLEKNFGFSSDVFDREKQSFSFPLLLSIEKEQQKLYYLLRIADIDAGLGFSLNKVLTNGYQTKSHVQYFHEPIAEEFSQTEIEYLILYLCEYLEKQASILLPETIGLEPFFRHIDRSQVIYGYWDGQFVEQYIENRDIYKQMVMELKKRFREEVVAKVIQRVESLIEEIVEENSGWCCNDQESSEMRFLRETMENDGLAVSIGEVKGREMVIERLLVTRFGVIDEDLAKVVPKLMMLGDRKYLELLLTLSRAELLNLP